MDGQLFDIIFSPINIALTVLLMTIFLYWIVTMLFGVDFDMDFDVDFDVEIDTDLDIDTDTGMDTSNLSFDDVANAEVKKENIIKDRRKELKWWQIILVYFNFVELPFMFTFTFWILCWWFLTVFFTYWTGSYDNAFGFVIFAAAIIPSLILTKILTAPFKSFFKNFNKDGEESIDFVGRTGVTLSKISGDRIGTVKIVIQSSPLTIYGKSLDGELIESGQDVLIIKEIVRQNILFYSIISNKLNTYGFIRNRSSNCNNRSSGRHIFNHCILSDYRYVLQKKSHRVRHSSKRGLEALQWPLTKGCMSFPYCIKSKSWIFPSRRLRSGGWE